MWWKNLYSGRKVSGADVELVRASINTIGRNKRRVSGQDHRQLLQSLNQGLK